MVYSRLSLDRGGEGLGVERQTADCRKLIEQREWTLVAPPFVDNDKSAAGRKPRPAFLALLDMIRRREVDAVVAWALDRLCRTARDRLALVEAAREAGVVIALVRGSDMDPTTPAGRLVIGVLGEVAQAEIDVKSDRQTRAHEQAAEQGRWVSGRKPFGFETDGVTVIDEEAEAIRDGYAALLAGDSLRGIAAEWNRRGLTTGQAPWKHTHLGERSPWRADSVRRVLVNPRYAGLRAHKGEERGQAEWPEIVSEATYRAAKLLIEDENRHNGGSGMDGRQLLTALALCGCTDCGLTVHGGGASHGQPIYRCRSGTMQPGDRARAAPVPGPHVSRLAAPCDEFVTGVVLERLRRADAVELLIDSERPDIPALRDRATALRGRLDSMAAEFAGDPEVTAAEYRTMTKIVRGQLAEAEAALADAGRVDLLGALVTAPDVAEVWARMSQDRQRAVINTLMVVRLMPVGRGTRTFRPESVEIVWREVG